LVPVIDQPFSRSQTAFASGKTWEAFVRERLLAPLGMKDTVPNPSALPAGANAATPHGEVEGVLSTVAPDDADNIAAAGGILSSARDMARWVSALLQAGGSQAAAGVLTPRLVQELWTAHTLMPITEPPAPLAALAPRFLAYGLGFNLRDYRGRKLVTHTGGLSGMVSRVALVPEENLAIVVLTNQDQAGGRVAFACSTPSWSPRGLDPAFRRPPVDEDHARAVGRTQPPRHDVEAFAPLAATRDATATPGTARRRSVEAIIS
jgi:CubicO group peptidase (beta-lactamase class C family)